MGHRALALRWSRSRSGFGVEGVWVAIGPCQFMTCRNALGASFRGRFLLEDRWADREILLCPEHEAVCSEAKRANRQMVLTPEGMVYLGAWLEYLVGKP